MVTQVWRVSGGAAVGGGGHAVSDGVVNVAEIVAGEQHSRGVFLLGIGDLSQRVIAVGPPERVFMDNLGALVGIIVGIVAMSIVMNLSLMMV